MEKEMFEHIWQDGTADYHMMNWWFDTFGSFGWILMISSLIIYFGIGILFAYYIHKDAIRKGSNNPEIWLLIVIILNIVGVILYFIVRNNYSITENAEKTGEA
ncbi:MAG: hypothetical protein ACTSWX_06410 [Promethearchaeota archaeon]